MFNRYFYFLFFLLGTNAAITNGLYLYDVFIIIILFYSSRKLIFYNAEFLTTIIVLLIIPAFISLLYQVIIYNHIEVYSIYLVYNLCLFCLYVIFLNNFYKDINVNYNYIVLLISMPLIMGFLMLAAPELNTLISDIYNVDLTYFNRFGSIWGRDVNQLGYYSTIVMFTTLILLKINKVKLSLGLIILILSIVSIALSGMRTGIIVLVGSTMFSFLFFKKSLLSVKYYIYLFFISLIAIFLFYQDLEKYFILLADRIDIELFIDHLSGETDGHVGGMYQKMYGIFINETDILKILFSFYPEWKFPDSLVIFYFSNGGLLGLFGVIIFIFLSIYNIIKIKEGSLRQYLFIVLLFCLVISFKGSFIFNNISMFLFILLYFELLKYEKQRKAERNRFDTDNR